MSRAATRSRPTWWSLPNTPTSSPIPSGPAWSRWWGRPIATGGARPWSRRCARSGLWTTSSRPAARSWAGEASRAANYALREGFKRQLEERRHEQSEAHRLLDLEVQGASERNTRALEDQVDTITSDSFFVFVESYDLRDEIDRLMDDRRRVRRTLEAEAERERAELEGQGDARDRASRGRTKAAQERLEGLEAARSPMEEAASAAEAVRVGMDEEIIALREAYREALEGLISELEGRGE
jgi:hypothetical protein